MKKYLIILLFAVSTFAYGQNRDCLCLDFNEVQLLIDSLSTHFPAICKQVNIGISSDGNPVIALKISDNVNSDESEPEILLEGSIHGAESVSSQMLCNLARELCLQYSSNYMIGYLVDNHEIWIVPVICPYGFINSVNVNANWVNLNRDAGYMWTGYFGSSPGPFSQPESKVMRDFILSRNLNIMIDYHSGIQGIIYPWFYRGDPCPDHNEVLNLATNYRSVSGYPAGEFEVMSGYDLYQTNGALIEFAYGSLGIDAFCVELFGGFSGDGCIGMQYNRASMLMMIEKSGHGVQGTITDVNTGNPVSATIHVDGKMPVYNSSLVGDYHKYLLPGTYSMTVSANGYNSETINNIVVPEAGAVTVDVQLTPNNSNRSAYKVITVKSIADDLVAADPLATWNVPGMPDGLYYAMGDTGYIVLDLGANIVNVSGPDITITGTASGAGNGYSLFWSSTPDGSWNIIGSGTSTQSFEAGSINAARYIKVLDNGSGPGNVLGAGFHLDAVTVVQTTVGIDDIATAIASFDVYPNPAMGNVSIRFPDTGGENSLITIMDISGKQVLSSNYQTAAGIVELNLSHLPRGMYFIRAQSKEMIETKKVILQ
jgi:predicted deacylase